jgi:hypothetical protein
MLAAPRSERAESVTSGFSLRTEYASRPLAPSLHGIPGVSGRGTGRRARHGPVVLLAHLLSVALFTVFSLARGLLEVLAIAPVLHRIAVYPQLRARSAGYFAANALIGGALVAYVSLVVCPAILSPLSVSPPLPPGDSLSTNIDLDALETESATWRDTAMNLRTRFVHLAALCCTAVLRALALLPNLMICDALVRAWTATMTVEASVTRVRTEVALGRSRHPDIVAAFALPTTVAVPKFHVDRIGIERQAANHPIQLRRRPPLVTPAEPDANGREKIAAIDAVVSSSTLTDPTSLERPLSASPPQLDGTPAFPSSLPLTHSPGAALPSRRGPASASTGGIVASTAASYFPGRFDQSSDAPYGYTHRFACSLVASIERVLFVLPLTLCSVLATLLPHGTLLSAALLAWRTAFSLFLFRWDAVAPTASIAVRTRHLQLHWAYFLGFGGAFTAMILPLPSGLRDLATCLVYPLFCVSTAVATGPVAYPTFLAMARSAVASKEVSAATHPSRLSASERSLRATARAKVRVAAILDPQGPDPAIILASLGSWQRKAVLAAGSVPSWLFAATGSLIPETGLGARRGQQAHASGKLPSSRVSLTPAFPVVRSRPVSYRSHSRSSTAAVTSGAPDACSSSLDSPLGERRRLSLPNANAELDSQLHRAARLQSLDDALTVLADARTGLPIFRPGEFLSRRFLVLVPPRLRLYVASETPTADKAL